MKILKLFGICVMFLLALSIVNAETNETALNNLLSGYSKAYDNGNFNVVLSDLSAKSQTMANPAGLAWDGTYLWFSDSNTKQIYKLDTTYMTVVDSFPSPGSSPRDLAWDGVYLWLADGNSDTIYKLTTDGTVVDSFVLGWAQPWGLTFDGTYLWNTAYFANKIYKINITTGLSVANFPMPTGTLPRGLAWDGTNLWNANPVSVQIYNLTTTGTVGNNFSSSDPDGLTFDGTYLWNAGGNTIYKLQTDGTIVDVYSDLFAVAAGEIEADFNVTGPGTGSEYTVIATLNVENEKLHPSKYLNINLIKNTTKTGAGISKIMFDGNYYIAPDPSYNSNTFRIDVKIYQNKTVQYQNEFEVIADHWTKPILFDWYKSLQIKAVDNAGDPKYDLVITNLTMYFSEGGTYTVGAYLWDNKSATAYAETAIVVPGSGHVYLDLGSLGQIGDYIEKNVSISFDSNQFKEFDLDNEKIYLKEISVDGNIMDYRHYPWSLGIGEFVDVYDIIDDAYNLVRASPVLSTSNFTFNEVYINNYAFDIINKDVNGKIKKLGVQLTAQDYSGVYDLELSLENVYGEVIEVKNITTDFLPDNTTTIFFNGTNIYNSKINGPYRLGFVRITKGVNEVFYKVDAAASMDLAYFNFTSPDFADLEVNDGNISSDGSNVTVRIFNKAAGDAAGVTVSLFDNSANKIRESILDSIAAGTFKDYTFKNTGLSTAFVAVDFSNNIEETNESNNIASNIPVNNPPVLDPIGDKPVNENQLLTFAISATDPDTLDVLTYSSSGLPAGAVFIDNGDGTGLFSWTPTFSQNGIYVITFNVTDGTDYDEETITINVGNTNRIPVISSTPGTTATRGVIYSYTLTATDADGEFLLLNAISKPAGANFIDYGDGTGLLTWTPGENAYGTANIQFSVSDGITPVMQSGTISITEDVYTLNALSLDYKDAKKGTFTYLANSPITINGQTQSSISTTPAVFTVNSNTEYPITHTAAGYTDETDYVYFDSRLPTCTAGSNCNLAGAYATICEWKVLDNDWYCSIEGGTLPKKTWFRYKRNPTQYLKRVNYLWKE